MLNTWLFRCNAKDQTLRRTIIMNPVANPTGFLLKIILNCSVFLLNNKTSFNFAPNQKITKP